MIHIVAPPVVGGVFDFAGSYRLALGPNAAELLQTTREAAKDWHASAVGTVFLQFSGYGYQTRGVPLWLLREFRRRRKEIKVLGVFFHELYAFGPPWASSFWLSPVQRHIARRLAELSDFWMTSREGSAQWLRRYAGGKPHAVLPVFSNVGELEAWPKERLPRLIVFGGPGLRQATYRAAGDELFTWARRAKLEVHDIGAAFPDPQLNDKLLRNGVIQHGRLDVQDISDLMRGASFGVLSYPVPYAAKSGVLAAYCAHGLCPIVLSREYPRVDGLVANLNYLPEMPSFATTECGDADTVAQAAWVWYQKHSLASHISSLINLSAQARARSM